MAGPGIGFALANLAASRIRPPLPGWAYVAIVLIGFGVLLPSWALMRLEPGPAGGMLALAWFPIAACAMAGVGWLFLAARRLPDREWRLAPRMAVAMVAPSLAEVVIFLGLIFNAVERATASLGAMPAAAIAATVSSVLFGVYHFTHRPPFNTWRIAAALMPIWLMVCLVFIASRNLWAATAFNTCLATAGLIRNRVTQPARRSWAMLTASAGAAIACAALVAALG